MGLSPDHQVGFSRRRTMGRAMCYIYCYKLRIGLLAVPGPEALEK